MVESGKLYFEEGEWHRPDDMHDLAIPQGVKVAIQYRVSKLPESSKDAMVAAAVIGREFDFPTLLKVIEGDEDSLITAIEDAVKAQLIEELRNKGPEYFSFSHALIPAALRETLGGLRRIRYHRRVAEAIQELRPEDFELLAYHYIKAGDEERGIEFTIKAADRAKLSYANQEAIRFYSEALAALPKDDQRRFELLSNRAGVYGTLAKRDPQGEDLKEMLSIADALDDNHLRVRALNPYANYLYRIDRLDQHRVFAEKAYHLAQGLSDPLLVGTAYIEYSNIFFFSGEFSRRLEILTQVKEILMKTELSDQSVRVLYNISRALAAIGQPEQALMSAKEALEISRKLNDSLWVATSLETIGKAHYMLSNFVKAREYLQQANQLFYKIEDKQSEFYSYLTMAAVERSLGNLEKNLEYLQKGLDIVWDIGEPTALAAGLINYSIYRYLYSGNLEDGINFLSQQIALTKASESPGLENMARFALALFQSYIGIYQTAFEEMHRLNSKLTGLDTYAWARALRIGFCLMGLGDYEQSRAVMLAAFEPILKRIMGFLCRVWRYDIKKEPPTTVDGFAQSHPYGSVSRNSHKRKTIPGGPTNVGPYCYLHYTPLKLFVKSLSKGSSVLPSIKTTLQIKVVFMEGSPPTLFELRTDKYAPQTRARHGLG
ncbi:MAG: tetratricopeptide repeat protein [Chloroflexi bacterium]|nr:tetratricopeptide repeat protein [Chloroflexota bacterium]